MITFIILKYTLYLFGSGMIFNTEIKKKKIKYFA